MRLAAVVLSLAMPVLAEEGPSCKERPDTAAEAPVCRYSQNPQNDLIKILIPLWQASGYGKNIKVYYLESAHEPNAVAMAPNVKPNTENVAKIGVTAGIWDLAQSDDELAFVLAHEMSHIVAQDIQYLQGIIPDLFKAWYETAAAKKLAADMNKRGLGEAEIATQMAAEFNRVIMNPRKRDVEQQADINALNLLRLANDAGAAWDIGAAITFLNRVGHEFPEHDAITIDSDHPSVSERITTVKQVQVFVVGGGYMKDHPDASGVRTKTREGSHAGVKRVNVRKAYKK